MMQPDWLIPGARVWVRGSKGWNLQTVTRVEWPWLVYTEEQPGAVHPGRVSRELALNIMESATGKKVRRENG